MRTGNYLSLLIMVREGTEDKYDDDALLVFELVDTIIYRAPLICVSEQKK